MDGVFDHEVPNNRPEEIPLDDLGGNNDDGDDEYFDSHDNFYRETSFVTGADIPIEMVDDEGRLSKIWLIVQNIKRFREIAIYKGKLIS